MLALTLAQLFGDSASQTATELVIKKADLAAVGLTPLFNNRAEQLVVAILLQILENFQGVLTDENGEYITDENGNPITYDQGDQFYEFLQLFLWELHIEQRSFGIVIRHTIIMHSFTYETE